MRRVRNQPEETRVVVLLTTVLVPGRTVVDISVRIVNEKMTFEMGFVFTFEEQIIARSDEYIGREYRNAGFGCVGC